MIDRFTSSSLLRTLLFTGLAILAMCSTSAAQNVTVAWNANTESNLAGYTVQYGTQAGSPSTSIDVGRVTSRAFTGLSSGTTYYFRVRAYNTSGVTSAPSTEVSYTVPGSTGSTAPTISSISPTSGSVAGGTVITVNGSRFVSGARVNIQGRAASTTYVSATQLRATAPAGTAGAASVQVVNPDNQSVTLNSAFTYVSSTASPTFGSVSPTSGPVAGGTQITVTGTNFLSGAVVRIGSRNATTTFISSTQLRAVTPAGSATGGTSVQIVNPNGTSASRSNAFYYTGSSTTGTAPKIDSVTPNSGPLAGGTTITIGGSGFVSGATVRIGSRAATSITFVSSSQLRARTPAGAAVGSTSVMVTNPNGLSASRGSGFYYYSSSSVTAAETTLASAQTLSLDQTAAVEADSLLSAEDVIAEASRALTSTSTVETAATLRRLPLDPAASTLRSRLALTNAGDTATTAKLTFTDAASKATELTVDLPARQRLTLDALTAPALRGPVAVDFDARADVALERLSLAADQAASSLTAAVSPAVKWEFAAGSTRAPFELGFAIENPGATEATVEARYLLAGNREPVAARYTVPAAGRTVVDLRRLEGLANADVAAEFTATSEAPVMVTRTQSLATSRGARVSETSGGVAEPSATWSVSGDTTGAVLALAIANPGDQPAVVEARYTTASGQRVTKRYDVAAQRRLTVDVAGEDASLASTTVDVEVESIGGAPVVVERTQWWGTRAGWTDGIANAAPATPAARWLFAEGEQGGADQALTTLRIANVSGQAVEARVTLLFEDAAETSAVVTVGAGASVTSPIARLAPAAEGKRFSILVEAVDGSTSLLVERRLFQRAGDGRVMGSASAAVAIP